jgi:uncharacterized membrane protein (Fun14 family)
MMFASAFQGVLGGVAAMALVGVICLAFFGLGYYLIVTYNKKGTKLFQDIQPMQYLGILLCFIGAIPFIQYFFFGFLSSAGSEAFSGLFDDE